MCIKTKIIRTFHNYYNYTLEEQVKRRKINSQSFAENELVYIFGSLISVAIYLKDRNIALGNYRSEDIYLSPEGYIKVYLLDYEPNNEHCSFFKILKDKK